jgi:osmotically-inducible protein OsmY
MKAKYSMVSAMAAVAIMASTVPLHANEADDNIESSFKKSFVYKTYLDKEHIKISSKNGVVTLSGDVSNESYKPIAQDTAEAIPGVKSVDNRIEVSNNHPAKSSDAWIKMQLQTALVLHRNVNSSKTDIYVGEGVVTLRGEVSSQAQKDLTTEYARDISGVKDVKNEMVIVGAPQTIGEKVDDASITAQLKMTLMLHRSTSAIRTTVTTTNGVVTLGGKAKSAAEKDLVTKIIEDVRGVSGVINNMTVSN